MLTPPIPAIRRSPLRDWGAAGLVAVLCVALAAMALPHATRSAAGALTVLVLLATAAGLAWRSRPRRPRREQLEALATRGQVTLQLTARSASDIGRAGLAYAVIARSDAGDLVLAHADEPASVFAVARYWQTRLGVPLLPGWGLTKADIEALDAKRALSLARISHRGPSQHGARGGAVSLVCSAIALFTLAGSVAIFRSQAPSGLSLVLFAVGVTLLVLLAATTRTDVTRIHVHDVLELERRCLGVRLGNLQLPLDEVRLLAVVSPDGRHGRHLMLAARDEFGAIECPAPLELVVRDPVVELRPSLANPAREREARGPRIVSGSGLH